MTARFSPRSSLQRLSRTVSSVSSATPKISISSTAIPTAPTAPSNPLLKALALLGAGISVGLGSSYFIPKPELLKLLYPERTEIPPTTESPKGIAWTKSIEAQLQELAIVKELRAAVDPLVTPNTTSAGSNLITNTSLAQKKYTESRPYATSIPGPHSLSAYTLRGPGKFAVPPLVFTNREKTEGIFVMHLGSSLCGHEGVVHGGLLATILDEALGRTAFLGLPSNIGVTATLTMNYRKPTFANQFVVLRTSLLEVKGRKAYVKGHIESLDGVILAEADALFVEPRMAKFLDNSSVKEAMG